MTIGSPVMRLSELGAAPAASLLARWGLGLTLLPGGKALGGSYWGDDEAGLVGSSVLARCDTPVHSLLHETSHLICMSGKRRASLHTHAGGDDLEEAAVCYLQVLLADWLPGVSRARMCADMDAWGYSFRLGNAAAWFRHDAEDASGWLLEHSLINAGGEPRWRLRS